jgi:23S rRNA (pseudouridine1915-N3)-methyltransferase
MMKIELVCIGRLKEKYWRDACTEYEKRLGRFCRFSIIELPEIRLPERPSEAQITAALDEEGEKILSAASGSALIALCIEGKELSSEALADRIASFGVHGVGSVSFLIGSSFGLSENVKRKTDFRLSMSPMTFPHQLVRVMVLEQIYRAFEILNHGKYHK